MELSRPASEDAWGYVHHLIDNKTYIPTGKSFNHNAILSETVKIVLERDNAPVESRW